MFDPFFSPLQKEIQDKGLHALLESKFHSQFTFRTTPPSISLLWESFLKILFRSQFSDDSPYLSLVVQCMLPLFKGLNEYTTEASIHDILDQSLFKYLDSVTRTRLTTKIHNFQLQLKDWVRGALHQKVSNVKMENVHFINEVYQLDSLWESAEFLFECGYPYFSGRSAFAAWKKFAGNRNLSYEDWVHAVMSADCSEDHPLQFEQSLETFFSGEKLLFFNGFGCNLESCPRCPLTDNCEFYRIHYNKQTENHLKLQIEAGNIKDIKTAHLIRFILNSSPRVADSDSEILDTFKRVHSENLGDFKLDPARFSLLAMKEIGRRGLERKTSLNQVSFTSSQAVYTHFETIVQDDKQESFFILLLDNKNKVITQKLITRGILDQSLVHPREVFASAIQARAASIILIHNHPSGVPTPSRQDINITRRLSEVGAVVGIQVLDHIIIGEGCHYSFVDQGIMPGTS